MSRGRKPSTPSYRLYKRTGQAIVCIDGRTIYLGPHRSPESRREYDRVIAEWLANGRRLTAEPEGETKLTVVELFARYWQHAQGYYRYKDGRPTTELDPLKRALDPLVALYGDTPVPEFGPLKLRAVRDRMIELGWSRGVINGYVNRIRRAFRWGVERELVPSGTLHALEAVVGLRRGRSEARETEPVRPVAEELVYAIRLHVARQVWAMIELQLHTGARAGEIVIMRGRDIDMTGKVWAYTPSSHKTEHHGKSRVIFLGPWAQAVVTEFLAADLNAYLFRPDAAVEEQNAAKRRARRTRRTHFSPIFGYNEAISKRAPRVFDRARRGNAFVLQNRFSPIARFSFAGGIVSPMQRTSRVIARRRVSQRSGKENR